MSRSTFTLEEPQARFDGRSHGAPDLDLAVRRLFWGGEDELGDVDESDPEFVEYAYQKMSDAGVPGDLAEAAIARWLASTSRTRRPPRR